MRDQAGGSTIAWFANPYKATLAILAATVLVCLAGCSSPSHSKASSTTLPPSKLPATSPGTSNQAPPSSAPASTLGGIILGIDTPVSNDAHVVSELGRAPGALDAFYTWNEPFPSSFISSVISEGSTPMITWNPASGRGANTKGYSLSDIVSGSADDVITQWATQAKQVNHVILVRLMHEMNGDWYPWGAGVDGNTPAEYVAAFQHVVDIFHRVGANNVQFVWCVATSAASALGNTASTPISAFFPGDQYVSWVAMDGYNRKPNKPRSFDQIFSSMYSKLTALSSRPVMVAETATISVPSNPDFQAQWISAGFESIPTHFPRIKAVFYFDSKGNGFSYPFDGNTTSEDAIRSVASSGTFEANVPAATLNF